jgi:hypothetical protein
VPVGETDGDTDADGDTDGDTDADGDTLGEVLVVGLVVTGTPVQATPLTANDVGFTLVPVWLPMKPGLTVPPLATEPFHDSLATVTWVPLCVKRPLQPCVTRWPLAKENVRFHEVHASPTLRMTMLPWKPLFHEPVTEYVTLQPVAALAGNAWTTERPPNPSAATAAIARRCFEVRLDTSLTAVSPSRRGAHAPDGLLAGPEGELMVSSRPGPDGPGVPHRVGRLAPTHTPSVRHTRVGSL